MSTLLKGREAGGVFNRGKWRRDGNEEVHNSVWTGESGHSINSAKDICK